jgi:hypothetical protein
LSSRNMSAAGLNDAFIIAISSLRNDKENRARNRRRHGCANLN